jgi:predicted SAM-dependent methyltransferase
MKKTKKQQLNVNLGCGSSVLESTEEIQWINIDNFEFTGEGKDNFLKADITKNLPIESNSVDYIICDQVLEHIAMKDIPAVLYNIHRILKVGGRCVIIVPDFEDAARQWLDARLNNGFSPIRYAWFSEVIYGNQVHEGEFHKTPMSAGFLHYVLNMAGLSKHEIVFHPAFGNIPLFPGIRAGYEDMQLRSAELVADIIKV